MPKRAMKSPASYRDMSAKKGKRRMCERILKRPCANSTRVLKRPSTIADDVPYTRHGASILKSRRERNVWKRDLTQLLLATHEDVVNMLLQDGLLNDQEGRECPACHTGKLGKLKRHPPVQDATYRCLRRGCQKRFLPHHGHPIFMVSRGQDHVPLRTQAAILFALLADVTQASIRILFQRNHKFTEGMQARLDQVCAEYVLLREPSIVYGQDHFWPDLEADEVDLRKSATVNEDGQARLAWEQWGGIVERGVPSSLILTRLNPAITKLRAPGAGAMRSTDWLPIANRHLKDTNVILHTDGARAYTLKVPGVLHDHVIHKKKRIEVNGDSVWIKPKYTRIVKHRLPGGEEVMVQAGTQVIDRFWRFLREKLQGRSSAVGSDTLLRRIRAAQWAFWHREQDLWIELGRSMTTLRTA